MQPSIIIDMIAHFIAKKFLPDASPAFGQMTDLELLSIVSWAERWDGKKVYDTAYSQVFPERQLEDAKTDFHVWLHSHSNLCLKTL